LFAYPDFTEIEKEQVSYSNIQFSEEKLDVFVRNVYLPKNADAGGLAQDVSGYLFKYDGQNQLRISLRLPEIEEMDRSPVTLEVYANRQLIDRLPIDHTGDYELIVPLKNIQGETLEITLIINARYENHGDARPFSFFIKKMWLED